MAITATTVQELIQSIDTNIRNKTARNSITPTTHSDVLTEVVQVLSGDTTSDEKTATLTLTRSDLDGIVSGTPLEFVAAVSGKVLVATLLQVKHNASGFTPFNLLLSEGDPAEIYIGYTGGNYQVKIPSTYINSTVDKELFNLGVAGGALLVNLPLTLSVTPATTLTQGDGSIDLKITYQEVSLL